MSSSREQPPLSPSQSGWRAGIGFWPATLTAFVLVMLILITPSTAVAAGNPKPAPPPGGHDVTQPWIMKQVADRPAAAPRGLKPRGRVQAMAPNASAAPSASVAQSASAAPAASAAARPLQKEVLGFAYSGSLNDPSVGYKTWNFSLLTSVAYFGLKVNADGTLDQTYIGWTIWQSSVASDFINYAHANGVRVLLSLIFQDNGQQMCTALNNRQTTIDQVAGQLKGADGIDIDYEGLNQTCPADNVSVRAKLNQFVQAVRARSLGYLNVDVYASSAEDPAGFYDIPTLAGSVDSLFVMVYALEASNGPCPTCMGPTAPLAGSAPNYTWNATRVATGYASYASKTILGFPYYGVAACVGAPTQPRPPANAPVMTGGAAQYTGVPYTTFASLPSDPNVSSYSESRDALDPNGEELWATYIRRDNTYNCWREAYWDDARSLGHKYDLVNQYGYRGAGIWTLDFGGSTPALWNQLSAKFTAPSNLGGRLIASPAVASWAQNRMDVFGLGGDSALWHMSWNGTSWSSWESLGGRLTSAPTAVSWGPNRIDIFARGGDNAIWHLVWDGNWRGWSSWQTLGGRFNSAPAVTSWGSNRLDLCAYGTDNGLYHMAWDGNQWAAWQGWEGLGGTLQSDPGAVSWSYNRIDIFGRGTDNSLMHKYWDGTGWHGWTREDGGPSGGLVSGPAVASKGSNRLEVVLTGTDSALWHMPWNGLSWQAWASLGGQWQYGPGAVSRSGTGTTDIFSVAADGALWRTQI